VALVLQDVKEGLVSRRWATELYGVVFDEIGQIDVVDTEKTRERIRQRRKTEAGFSAKSKADLGWNAAGSPIVCSRCGSELSAPAFIEIPWTSIGPYFSALELNGLFRLVAAVCISCGALVTVRAIFVE
jgi:hypothetical protein